MIYTTAKQDYHTKVLSDVAFALTATDYKDPPTITFIGGGHEENMDTAVRRLTPLECERLQFFPDGWTDIGDWVDTTGKVRKTTDSARYKALGNSIALPYFKVIAKRISAQYDRDITMGGLFSGIGGFEKCFADINGLHNVKWSSEIEEFPIAVLKRHFGDEEHEGDFYKFSK